MRLLNLEIVTITPEIVTDEFDSGVQLELSRLRMVEYWNGAHSIEGDWHAPRIPVRIVPEHHEIYVIDPLLIDLCETLSQLRDSLSTETKPEVLI